MIELRDYQKEAVASLFKYWEIKSGNPLINAPMGAGKSIIIAAFIKLALSLYGDTRIIVLSHVAKILTQDFQKLYEMWPEAPSGVYSASLGIRQMNAQILFAMIQSIYQKGYSNRKTDLVILDEAHLLSPKDETRYRTFLKALKEINPDLKVCGFSGTPYRLDSGWLHKGENALFTDICFDINILDLIKQGYLVEPVSKAATTKIDLSKLHLRGGEYIPAEMQATIDKDEITKSAVREIIKFGKDRKLWIVFSSGLHHSKHICEELTLNGTTCASIDGDMSEPARESLFKQAANNELRCLVNYGTLTTGLDLPAIDLIALLRKTKSTSLYQQMIGRGLRVMPGKKNCAVLDFCSNIVFHGCIDNVIIRDKNTVEDGEMPAKECPKCHSIIAAGYRICPDCKYEFPPPKPKFEGKAKKAPLLTTQIPQIPEWRPVEMATYYLHKKAGSSDSLKAIYKTEWGWVTEWHSFGHVSAYARSKAETWWRERGGKIPYPATALEALNRIDEIKGVKTVQIKVQKDGKYDKISGYKIIKTPSNIISRTGNLGVIYVST